jgi:type II secretory pathway pseudopilin PulG
MNQRNQLGTAQRSRGFSTLELLLVMAVSLVIAAFALPGFEQVKRTLRISGDARNLNGAINQAKMQAAADFTETRVYIDLGANNINTFHVDMWNKVNNCWQVIGDDFTKRPCLVPGVSPVQYLSQGVSFGTGGVAAPPVNTQIAISQGPGGFSCAPVNGKRVGQQPTTACIQFNSRGIPIDINNGGVPTGNGAFYITDNTQTYGVTVGAAGLSQVWANNINGNTNWYRK